MRLLYMNMINKTT